MPWSSVQAPRLSRAVAVAALLAGIICLGAYFRLWAITQMPPLSLTDDEAYYGLDALSILEGHWMVFSPLQTGREALYMTLVAGVFKVFGVSVLSFRIFTAALGILTLPAMFWLGWEAAPDRRGATRLGLLAAAISAVLLMHIIVNRNALRVNMQPLFAALTAAALFHALRTHRRFWFVVAGVLLGLCLHTYVTARLLPLVVLAAFALEWFANHKEWKRHLGHLASVAGPALLVFVPLGLYFLRHPEMFLHRAGQLFDPGTLPQSIKATLLIFYQQGDLILQSNLPGRPVFDLLQGLGFAVGAVLALIGHYRQTGWLLLIWFVIGVFPSAFAKDAPSYIHAFGMIPPMVLLIALGFSSVSRWLVELAHRFAPAAPVAEWIGAGALALSLSYSVTQTHVDLFTHWAGRGDFPLAYRTDLTRIDRYVQQSPASTEFFFSPYERIDPELAFYRRGDLNRLHPFNGLACLPLGNALGRELVYFVSDPVSLAQLKRYFPTGQGIREPELQVWKVPVGAQPQLPPGDGHSAQWVDQLKLHDAQVQVVDAHTVSISLVWEVRSSESLVDYHRFIHLVSADASQPGGVQLWAQDDRTVCSDSHPPRQRQPGEKIIEVIPLSLSDGLPPNDYVVAVGFYEFGAPARLAVEKSTWPVRENAVLISQFSVP